MNWMRVASPASLILVGSLIIHLGLAWLLVGSPEGLDRTW